ncbi:MgtC/SapB family protein [Methylobacterium sp. NEAU K]|uniref:MgtC/SapB family protein n=1 Tax=Methylobacterium sp. NEAU K TaxID=3064946 RepID=UPI002733490D|nr:MgtC/SapB family protein [Methylobacterium sp. NEAU K]MDP4005463.1 MgtC/SapB family protein [Methylobacterium sp. NEAU K]
MMMTATDLCLRLGASVVAGMVVGFNREMHAKPVGVRTLGLVGLGSALVTMAGSGFLAEGVDANASRAIQGIVTGIGFLGAGVIVKGARKSHVHGMTTAAAIWVTSALGISCGVGAYLPVAVGVILLLLLIGIGGRIDRIIDARWLKKHGSDAAQAQASRQGSTPPD